MKFYAHNRHLHRHRTNYVANTSRHIHRTVLLFAISMLWAASACPNAQECRCHSEAQEILLLCKDRNLDEVPHFDDTSLQFTEVRLDGNRIQTVPSNAFQTTSGQGLHTLLLDLSDNRITSIDDNAFAGLEDHLEILKLDVSSMPSFPTRALAILTNLKKLYLKGFSMPSLPNDAFSTLTSLNIVSLERCELTSLSSSVFNSQKNTLTEVYLKFNSLTSVPKQALNSLLALSHLDLGGNAITTIANDDFSEMSALEWLDISQNGVDTIQSNAFRGVHDTLRVLSLRHNGDSLIHSDLSALQSLSSLEELDLSYNAINQIPADLFRQMSQLQTLDMRHNQISTIEINDFEDLGPSLKSLNLANNGLNDLAQLSFQTLSGLEELFLDNNPLQGTLNENTFFGLDNLKTLKLMAVDFTSRDFNSIWTLRSLETLNLESNAIDNVPNNTFQSLNSLSSIHLGENSIATLTQWSLHGLEQSLEYLWLDDNDITTLSSCLLNGFTHHVYLSLSDNPLHCDCDAYWLRLRIDNMDDTTRLLNDWTCASPDQHDGKKLKDIDYSDLCDPPPTAEQCAEISTTTSTVSPSTPPATSRGPTSPMVVDTTDIKAHSIKVVWVVQSHEDIITGFTLQCEAEDGTIHTQNKHYSSSTRSAMLEELRASTQYFICVTAHTEANQERTCTDATTMPSSGAVKSSAMTLQIILGCVLAVVATGLVVGIVLTVVCIKRRKNKRYPPVHKSTTSINSTVPIVGDQSKRFSKPKPYSVSTDNIFTSIEMERKLEGFTSDERDRILRLFSKSGASTLSMMSTASSRYVPDPSGAVGGAYSNEIPLQDEGQYEELPGDQYNYIEYNDINPDIDNKQADVHPPPLRADSFI